MIYVDKFVLPTPDEELGIYRVRSGQNIGYVLNAYPLGIFTRNGLSEVDFDKITVFAGSNGSGKSTLLNLIAEKLELDRIAPYNRGEMFDLFVSKCKTQMAYNDFGRKMRVPNGSAIISSDDIFDYMLTVRSANQEFESEFEEVKEDRERLFYGKTIKFTGLDMPEYDDFIKQVRARRPSVTRRRFVVEQVGTGIKEFSNGETALEYFDRRLKNDTLYCLDEPENSLAPHMQIKLKKTLEQKARYCGCQFIIATHSPFLLSIEGAKIYDLDATPVDLKKWYQLKNSKTYYEFFKSNAKLFEQSSDR